MEKTNKIKAVCDIQLLNNYWCQNYLSADDRQEALNDYAIKTALVVGFYVDESVDPAFIAVYNLTPKSLHVTHVVGNFGRYVTALDEFTRMLARMCGYVEVTFCSKRRAIMNQWAKREGYTPSEIEFEFKKRVA